MTYQDFSKRFSMAYFWNPRARLHGDLNLTFTEYAQRYLFWKAAPCICILGGPPGVARTFALGADFCCFAPLAQLSFLASRSLNPEKSTLPQEKICSSLSLHSSCQLAPPATVLPVCAAFSAPVSNWWFRAGGSTKKKFNENEGHGSFLIMRQNESAESSSTQVCAASQASFVVLTAHAGSDRWLSKLWERQLWKTEKGWTNLRKGKLYIIGKRLGFWQGLW